MQLSESTKETLLEVVAVLTLLDEEEDEAAIDMISTNPVNLVFAMSSIILGVLDINGQTPEDLAKRVLMGGEF